MEGQESNYGNLAMCKMNMILHNITDFKIEYGDVISNPKLVNGGKLKNYDRVIADFPFSMVVLKDTFEARNLYANYWNQGQGVSSLLPC